MGWKPGIYVQQNMVAYEGSQLKSVRKLEQERRGDTRGGGGGSGLGGQQHAMRMKVSYKAQL